MLTNTWRQRLHGTHTAFRRAGLIIGLASCSVVAIATIWGWIFNDPIDVAGPARSAVNRTALVGSYAQDCVTRWLTATASHQQVLHDCWSLRDPMKLPTTPALIVTSPAVSAVTLVSDAGTTQQWSVVITVSERPFEAATPPHRLLPAARRLQQLRTAGQRTTGPGQRARRRRGRAAGLFHCGRRHLTGFHHGQRIHHQLFDRRRRAGTLRHHQLRAASRRGLPLRPSHQTRLQPRPRRSRCAC